MQFGIGFVRKFYLCRIRIIRIARHRDHGKGGKGKERVEKGTCESDESASERVDTVERIALGVDARRRGVERCLKIALSFHAAVSAEGQKR